MLSLGSGGGAGASGVLNRSGLRPSVCILIRTAGSGIPTLSILKKRSNRGSWPTVNTGGGGGPDGSASCVISGGGGGGCEFWFACDKGGGGGGGGPPPVFDSLVGCCCWAGWFSNFKSLTSSIEFSYKNAYFRIILF